MENREPRIPQEKLFSIISWIFSALIVVACFLIFLVSYKIAYSTVGMFISGRMSVVLCYFIVSILAILTAVLLKIIMRKRILLRRLLMIAALLPIVCYLLNYHTLKKDGLLYFLVEDGGMLHFMAIGDYDFDGMNDQEHHRLYEKRVVSVSCHDSFFRDEIKMVSMSTTGIGAGLNGYFCKLDGENRLITLHLQKTAVEIKQIELEICLADAKQSLPLSFYLQTDNGEVLVPYTINSDGNISVKFDTDTCSNWLKNSENEFPRMILRYEFN